MPHPLVLATPISPTLKRASSSPPPKQAAHRRPSSIEARMPNALSKILDQNREAQTSIDEVRIPKTSRDMDQSLFAALVENLIDPKASPANEGLAIFNKINASQSTIGRSGVRAILAVENITYGNTSESRNAAMLELMAINVTRNSLNGVSEFLTRFRDLRARSSCDVS